MANYAVVDKVITGTPTVAMAEAETYIETLDETTGAIISLQVVGNNEYITICIIHKG